MASIYDKASLVLIPSGTKTSKVYSQKPTNGDGDFTFSRSTAATRVNASGNIEKETQNLLLQSNSFLTSWVRSGYTLTSGQSGYDGSSNAWLAECTSAGQALYQTSNASGVSTFSMHLKEGTANFLRLRADQSVDAIAVFDLSNGSVHSFNGNVIDTNVVDLGGGWYRCSITWNIDTLSNVQVRAEDGNGSPILGTFYIQDAQLEQGLVARDYIETTTTAIYGGITDNVPRLDYTDSSCPALLLEPQRTNLATQSEYFTDIFTENSGVTWESNSTTSPEGLVNASKLNNSNAGSSGAYYVPLAFTDNDTMTASIFAKEGDVSELLFGITNQNESKSLYYSFDLSAGTATYNANNGGILNSSGSIVDYGNGWYRCIVTGTFPSSGTTSGGVFPRIPQAGYVYLYGLQVEKNVSYATSYIPTYGSAVTRNNDTYKKLGFGNTSTEGTFFAEFEVKKIESANGQYMYGLGVGTTDLGSFFATASGALSIISNGSKIEGYNNGYATSLFSFTPLIGDIVKIAIRYDGTNVVGFVNGVKQTIKTDNVTGVKNTIRVNHGEKSSHATKQLLYIPTALTDQEAIDLTTI